MSTFAILSSSPWVERLGWTLVHFLWQGVAIGLLYAAARWLLRTATPNARYLLACFTLSAMLAAPVVTWESMRPSPSTPDAAYRIRDTPPTASAGTVVTSVTRGPETPVVPSLPFLPWIVIAWLAGAAFFWVRLAGGWMVAARMRSTQVRPAPAEWQQSLHTLGLRIGLSRPVRLLISALTEVPTVVGWLRPVVLLPVGALTGLPAEHVEGLLLHELAHIRRHDYLVNILQSVAEALLFYHPAVWWVSSHIRAERELCCDDIAVSVSGDAFTYACALTQLESQRPPHLAATLAANGPSLAHRIARLVGAPQPAARISLGPAVITLAILLGTAGYGLFAQSEAHPAFEVASIKANPLPPGEAETRAMGVGYRPGGRMVATAASLRLLIQFAYANHDTPHWSPLLASRVIGGPSWVATPGYDIEAKPPSETDPQHAWLMLQTLLADRFKLAIHRETLELPAYDLTVAKGGLKLPAPRAVGCVSFPPGTPPRQVPGRVDCGNVFGPFTNNSTLRMDGSSIHMAHLVRALSLPLDRPVIDKTGFTGMFDLHISFTPDDALLGMPGYGAPGDPSAANIFAALEQQLGLKLVAVKAPVEVLVIDHAERPTAN